MCPTSRDVQCSPQIICTGELRRDVGTGEQLLHCRSQNVPWAVQARSAHNVRPIALDEHAANGLPMQSNAVARGDAASRASRHSFKDGSPDGGLQSGEDMGVQRLQAPGHAAGNDDDCDAQSEALRQDGVASVYAAVIHDQDQRSAWCHLSNTPSQFSQIMDHDGTGVPT